MFAFKVPCTLVKPAAGVIHQAGWVQCIGPLGDAGSIKLTPAFIERPPDGNRDHIVEMLDHALVFEHELLAVFQAASAQAPVAAVIAQGFEQGGK